MKNLIFFPFAFHTGRKSGENVNLNQAQTIYMKNICVACASAKRHNADADVALVTDVSLPEEYKRVLESLGVLIIYQPFDCFIFDNGYTWNLAFYKLCALKGVTEKYAYDNYCYMDVDVVIQDSLNDVFEECAEHVLLYDINHGLSVKDYRIILAEFEDFLGEKRYITHYGGEFVATSKENAGQFVKACVAVYEEMIDKKFETTKGDEFILSVAASRMKESIKNAGAYIFRFWTGDFYLVSTCYKFNPVKILHLPACKNTALVKLYDKYISKGKFPDMKYIWRICCVDRPSFVRDMKVKVKNHLLKMLGE